MEVKELIELEEQHYRDGNWESLGKLYTEDTEFTSADGSVIRGRDAVIAYARREAEAFTDNALTQELVAVDGDTAVVLWSWSGTHSKDLVAPSGQKLPATGTRVSIDAVSICTISDGRISSARRYHDRLGMMLALGIVRLPGGGA